MSEPPPFPQPPGGQDPDPRWAPPAYYPPPPPGAYGPGYYAPPPLAFLPPGVQLASWGVRLAAWLIDGIIASVLALVFAVGTGFGVYGAMTGEDAESAGWVTGVLVYIGVTFLWFMLYEPLTMRRQGAHNGQTWAKQWLGIRVIREDGQPVTAGTAIVRDVVMQGLVFGVLGGFFAFSVPALLDGLWPLWDERNQALHDKVANTLVVQA